MKTTIEIADDLLLKAKQLARDRNTTLRSLTEEGLRKVLEDCGRRKPYSYEPVTFGDKGFTEDFRDANWEDLRDEIYPFRGT